MNNKLYSFLLSENISHYIMHPIKDAAKTGKEKYFVNRGDIFGNKKENIVQFIGKLISAPTYEIAVSMLKKEKRKFNWSKIPYDVLKHIETILFNCTEDNYVDKLIIYRNSFTI